MWEVVTAAILIALIAVLALSRVRYYRRMFSDSHFREFHNAMATAIHAASATGDPQEKTNEGEIFFTTKAGLGAVVTFSALPEGGYNLHISLSQPGRMTTSAVSRHFGLFIIAMLQGNKAELMPYFTDTGVRHLSFQLPSPVATIQDYGAARLSYEKYVRENRTVSFEYRNMETTETAASAPPPGTAR